MKWGLALVAILGIVIWWMNYPKPGEKQRFLLLATALAVVIGLVMWLV